MTFIPRVPGSDRVEHAEVSVISAPIDPPAGVSIGLATAHEYVVVRLTDSAGCTGWGETYLLPGVERVIVELARLVIGAPAGAMRYHRDRLARTRTGGYAQSALLLALDDLRARQRGMPLHALYGGPVRDSITAYAASQGYVEGEELEHTWTREAETFLEAGFTAIKLRTGRYPVDREARALERVRELVGPDVALMVDGNGGYTLGQALHMGEVLHDLDARWFEEPLPQDGYHGYGALRGRLQVPLAGGEIAESPDEAGQLLTSQAVDIIQPDVVICGGVVGALDVAVNAAAHGVSMIPHTSGGAIGIAATVQLLALMPDESRSPAADPVLLEFGQGPNPWRTELLETPLSPEAGRVRIPDGPGLGWQVDAATIIDRRVAHWEVTR